MPELKLGSALGYSDGIGVTLQEDMTVLEVEGEVTPTSAAGGVGLVSGPLGLVTKAVRCGD